MGWWSRWMLVMSLGAFLVYALDASFNNRGFFADGAYFFIHALTKPEWLRYADDPALLRLLVNIINQLPLILLTNAGVTDPFWLRLSFNAPLFFNNALVLVGLWLISRKHQFHRVAIWATLSYVATVLPSDLFAVNQARLSQSFYWVLLFFVLTPRALSRIELAMAVSLGIICFRSHESILFFGPLLSMASWLSLRHDPVNQGFKKLMMVLGLLWMVFDIYWQTTRPTGYSTLVFVGSVLYWRVLDIVFSSMFFVWTSGLVLLWHWWRCRSGDQSFSLSLKAVLALHFLACLGVGLVPAINPDLSWPTGEFAFRIFIPFGGAFLFLLALYDWRSGLLEQLNPNVCAIVFSSALIGLSVWQYLSTRQWVVFQNAVKEAVSSSVAPVVVWERAFEKLSPDVQHTWKRYRWDWALPAMSLAVSDLPQVNAVLSPEASGKLFYFNTHERTLSIPFKTIDSPRVDLQRIDAACRLRPAELPAGFCR